MKKEKKFLYIGLIGIILVVSSILVSILIYPNYDFGEQYLSELGVDSTALIFNFGLMISSVLMVPFFYYIFYKKDNLSKILFALVIISLIGLFGVGFFPLTLNVEHFISAAIFFIFISIFFILFLIKQFSEKKFIKLENLIALIGAISSISFMFFLRNPMMQKISVSFVLLWIAIIIIKNLKEYD